MIVYTAYYSIARVFSWFVRNVLTEESTSFFKNAQFSTDVLGNELKEEDSKTYHTSLAS